MSACEKCWRDAGIRAFTQMRSQAECYQEILEERKDSHCTFEEQAGEGAEICPKCFTKSIHVITGECMRCNYNA